MHRMIRRGRIYGPRFDPRTADNPANEETTSRGLHFLCLNADIAGQFEMVQHSWLNGSIDPHGETDPLSHWPDRGSDLTIQHRPTNLRVEIPAMVRVRGGGYFFMPSLTALRSLAERVARKAADGSPERGMLTRASKEAARELTHV
jgi:deferrochelatase/peroxidase EfeB